jgi:hypothetical protein
MGESRRLLHGEMTISALTAKVPLTSVGAFVRSQISFPWNDPFFWNSITSLPVTSCHLAIKVFSGFGLQETIKKTHNRKQRDNRVIFFITLLIYKI